MLAQDGSSRHGSMLDVLCFIHVNCLATLLNFTCTYRRVHWSNDQQTPCRVKVNLNFNPNPPKQRKHVQLFEMWCVELKLVIINSFEYALVAKVANVEINNRLDGATQNLCASGDYHLWLSTHIPATSSHAYPRYTINPSTYWKYTVTRRCALFHQQQDC